MKSIVITPESIEQRYDVYIAGDSYNTFIRNVTTARAEFNTEPRVCTTDDGVSVRLYREVPLTSAAKYALYTLTTAEFEVANGNWSNA
jgi:hypothetical protein